MKILHVFDDYGTPGERVLPGMGSVPTVVYYIAKYLVAKGYDVTILERDQGVLPKEDEINGIRYIRFNAKKLPEPPYRLIKNPFKMMWLIKDVFYVAREINKYLKKENFDIIHIHFPFASCVLVDINKRLRKKIVYTAHTGEHRLGLSKYLKPPIAVRVFSPDLYLIKRVIRTVVLNYSLKDKLIEKGIEAEKIKVIPNGIDIKNINICKKKVREIETKYGIDKDKIKVMFAGVIAPWKGVYHLIQAAEKVLKDIDVLFILAGNTEFDERYTKKIIKYINNKKLNNKIKLIGFVPYEELKVLYYMCDIFVLPSLEEGFGLVLTEALALGKPVIGSNVGGIPMQIRDGWNGFLVEPGNERQLAEKIRYLIENEEERIRMGKNSRKLAENKFDWRKIAEKYLKVYKEVVI